MKRRIILIFAAVAVVVGAGLAIGADEKKEAPKPDKGKQVEGERRGRSGRPGRPEGRAGGAEGRRPARSPRGGFNQQFEQRGKRHKAEMKQLEAIKKMAVKEKATKTAEMIQKLIDKKQTAFDEIVKQGEERRERFMKMMEERGDRAPGDREGRRSRGPRPGRERTGDGKKEVDKDKGKN